MKPLFLARRSRLMLLSCLVASVFAGVSVTSVAGAQAQGAADEAELRFQLGADAYQRGDYREALEQFLASNRLVPNRNVVFNIARAYERLDRWAESYRYYVDALGGEPDEATRREIEQALERLAANIGIVDVETDPPGATIYVDRRDLGSVGRSPRSLAFRPGTYRILVSKDGFEPAQTEPMELGAGDRREVRLELQRIVGRLELTGEAGTEVRVDTERGEAACVVPCTLDLPPGPHEVHLRRSGRAPVSRVVRIAVDATEQVDARLPALTGSLLVNADERDALVEVDGRPEGFTPAVIPDVPVGTRRVRVSLRGYRAVERVIAVRQGEQTLVDDIRLVPVREVAAASRMRERVEDAPASVSIVSAQEIDAFRYPSVFEALRGVRGVALTHDSIYGNASIRGLGQPNDYNNRMVLLLDGATLNENILYTPFLGFEGRADLGDVEQIEVVRGPGSVIYGTGAVSGVVNLVPRRREEPTHAEASVGTVGEGIARGRATGHLRAGDHSGVRLSVSGARSDGADLAMFFDADEDGLPERNVAHGVRSFDGAYTYGTAWHGPWTAQWTYSWREIEIPTGSFDTTFDDPRNIYDDRRGLAEVRFEPELSDSVQLFTRAYANYGYFHLDYFYETEDLDPDTGDPFVQPYSETYVGVWFGGEARVVLTPSDELRVSVGAEASHNPLADMRVYQLEASGEQTDLLDTHTPFSIFAAYVLADWSLAEWVRVSAGVRADAWRVVEPAESFVSANPRLALIFYPTEIDTVKVMGGRAFRAPSIYEIFYEDLGITSLSSTCCGQQLVPEVYYQAEVEYTHAFDQEWSALAAVHALWGQDFIGTVPVPGDPDLIYYRNIEEDQLIVGGDLEVRREMRGGWMLAAWYGYLRARFLEAPDVVDATGARSVPNAPSHSGGVKGVVPLIPTTLVLASRVTLEAPRRIALDTNDRTEWALVADLVLTGKAQRFPVEYAFGVYNLLDWRYSLPVNPFPAPVMPQAGRTFMASLTLRL